jgi:DNA-directed RNA polymerase specialized sigma24 family protein
MNSEARETLSKETEAYLRRVLMARVELDNWDEKQELIHDCLTECCVQLPAYRGENGASLNTFLTKVALNEAYAFLRKKNRRKKILQRNWKTIIREPWIVGGHERPSKEEARIISAKSDQPSVENFG